MNERITIGQYYPVHSYIHSLDPRVKLMGTFVYITMIFFANNVFSYLTAALCLLTVIYMSKVPLKFMIKGLRSIMFILLFTVTLNIFFTPGDTAIFEFYAVKITLEGLFSAGKMAVRLVLLIVSSSVMTLTTTPLALTDALEFFLFPFSKIGLPSQEIAMMMTIALRFIPTLMEEMDKIIKAQKARGADFETGGVIKRIKALVPLLVPLFVSSFRRAEELAMAMEARCYRTDVKRTKMKELKFEKIDYTSLFYIIMFIIAILTLRLV